MIRALVTIALGLLLSGLGLFVGWQMSAGTRSAEDHDEHEHEHEDEHEDDHDHDHDMHEDEVALSEQTLKTLGVVIEHVQPTDFVRTIDVRSVLVDRPENRRTVVAPVGGIVQGVHVESGQVVAARAPLVDILRDPIPVGGKETVASVLLSLREEVHDAVAALRTARTELDIAEKEIARIRAIADRSEHGKPELFSSRLVELEYARARAARGVANAEAELDEKGLTRAEIVRVADGHHAPDLPVLWQRVLRMQGLWGDLEEALLARLPETERAKPWPLAVLAELNLQGLTTPALLDLLTEHPQAAVRFREVAALLLQGRSIENVAMIADLGALEPDVTLQAPASSGEEWDIERLLVRVGLHLDAGEAVVALHDPRRLWLRVEPIGQEIAHVRRAVQEHLLCEAVPVLPGAAPRLDAVHLRRLAPDGEQGTLAFAEIENTILHQEEGRRSWSLQAGTEFLVRVPLETLAGRFVLPVDAVVRDGPDRVVYVVEEAHDHEHEDHEHEGEDHDEDHEDHEDHDDHDEDHDDHHEDEDHHHLHFHPVPVHVELDTETVVVIAADGALQPGQEIVVRGAFALHLALQQGGGEEDAGHGHSHH